MKKFISGLLIALLVFGVVNISALKTEAATENSKAGVVNIISGNLNVRKSASVSSGIIAILSKGSYVTLISKSGSWWYLEYEDGKYGYCHENYINEVYGVNKYVNIGVGALNVRKGDGTSYAIKDTLVKNEQVIELWKKGEWSYILYDGNEKGFVSSEYLSVKNESSNKYEKINLQVPYFMQTDSRWSSVKLGTSGKTIGQIGCTTTGISMMESYRKGYNIYPDEMAKKLNYTQSGDLYWPSDYKAVTSKEGYLSKIYSLLKEGKPVLFGSKNSYGSQHWVVITGYKGTESLKASDFTINDPGTSKRVTLQDFLNSYPNFYKFFYY